MTHPSSHGARSALEASRHRRAGHRRESISDLAQQALLGDVPSLRRLIEMLGDPGEHVSEAAADALVHLGTAAVGPLVGVLANRSASRPLRMGAATALSGISHPDATDVLAQVLLDSTDDLLVRRLLALYLGRAHPPIALDTLSHVASQEGEDAELRLSAIQALGELGDPGAMRALREILRQRDVRVVRESVQEEISRIGVRQRHADPATALEFSAVIAEASSGVSLHDASRQALARVRRDAGPLEGM